MDSQPITITEFQCLAIEQMQAAFPIIKTAGVNMRLSNAINTPAIFLELIEFSYPDNHARTDPILDCIFNLHVVSTSLDDKPVLALEELAINIANFIRGNRWGVYAEPAELISSSADDFTPLDDAYKVWSIRFKQQIAIKAHQNLLEKLTSHAC